VTIQSHSSSLLSQAHMVVFGCEAKCGVLLHITLQFSDILSLSRTMSPIEITGGVRKRFIEVAALLHMLDPVRGEPTIHGLDQDPIEIETPKERLLKRKFLDSFALVCATKKGGDSVSAACMDEGLPQGTTIRIASNSGVRTQTLNQLRELVNLLNNVDSGGVLSK